MTPARWDLRWYRGGAWRRRLVRRDLTRAVLTIDPPVTLELRIADTPATNTPLLVVTATIGTDNLWAELAVTGEQTATLADHLHEHRVYVGAERRLLLHGYVNLVDSVGEA